MFRTMVRGLATTAVMAALVGGAAAGAANAQQMSGVPGGHATAAVQPTTRDMSVTPKCYMGGQPYLTGEGVRIRATPGGTILGLAYTSDSIAWHFEAYGNTYYITDASRGITGYISMQYVWWTTAGTCPAG
jgi:hypothetical protein